MLLLMLLLVFWLQVPTIAKRLKTICVFRTYKGSNQNYYRPGDLIIGGNLPLGINFESPVFNFNTWNHYLNNNHHKTFIFSLKKESLFHQLGVGFEFSQGERRVYPSFFWINPKESPQYVGLVQLLLHFQWNWAPEDDRGERFVSTLTPMLQEKEICLAFTLGLDNFKSTMEKFFLNSRTWFKAEVYIMYGDFKVMSIVFGAVHVFENTVKVSFRKVCIFTSHWKIGMKESETTLQYIKLLHGVLHFRDHSRDVPEFIHFLLSLNPLNP
ncbi:hypothetical protein E2320_022129 [Naja naja]|nr:hypothetical protein E2320_022129 [Naja naja]